MITNLQLQHAHSLEMGRRYFWRRPGKPSSREPKLVIVTFDDFGACPADGIVIDTAGKRWRCYIEDLLELRS